MNDVNGFKEDHSHTNWKIFWLFLFNGVALAALAYEKLKGFSESKAILLTASAFFLICHNIYHYYHLWLAPSAFYRGITKDGKSVWLGSKLVLPEGKYELTVSHLLADGKLKEVNRWGTCVGKWITEDGFVETTAVAADLKNIRLSER